MHRWTALGLLLGAGALVAAGCAGTSTTGGRRSGTTTTTRAFPVTSSPSTSNATPMLGASNSGCHGCGEVGPAAVTLDGYTQDGMAFGGMMFTEVHWQSWGAVQATAPMTHAYYESPGEYGAVTLVAFDLGLCGSTYGYRALEWVGSSQAFDPSSYFDTCTGTGVGRGFPGYPQ